MEALVGGDRSLRAVLVRFHRGQGGANAGEIVGRRTHGRQRRSLGLDDRAGLFECEQEVVVEPVLAAHPAEHVGIEQGPFVERAHLCAMARPYAQEALGRQNLHGFADDAAAGAIALRQLEFRRQHGSRGDLAAHDRGSESLDHRSDLSRFAALLHVSRPSATTRLSRSPLACNHSSDV